MIHASELLRVSRPYRLDLGWPLTMQGQEVQRGFPHGEGSARARGCTWRVVSAGRTKDEGTWTEPAESQVKKSLAPIRELPFIT